MQIKIAKVEVAKSMKRIELLKAAFTRALDLSIKQIDRTVVNSSFADFDDIHENTIQNCVINSLGLLSKDIEVFNCLAEIILLLLMAYLLTFVMLYAFRFRPRFLKH